MEVFIIQESEGEKKQRQADKYELQIFVIVSSWPAKIKKIPEIRSYFLFVFGYLKSQNFPQISLPDYPFSHHVLHRDFLVRPSKNTAKKFLSAVALELI